MLHLISALTAELRGIYVRTETATLMQKVKLSQNCLGISVTRIVFAAVFSS